MLVFIDEKTKFNHFLNKNEIVTYKNLNDLANKINKFNIDNKLRMKVAKKGRDKYFKYFNSTIISDYILQKSFGIKTKNFYWEKKIR